MTNVTTLLKIFYNSDSLVQSKSLQHYWVQEDSFRNFSEEKRERADWQFNITKNPSLKINVKHGNQMDNFRNIVISEKWIFSLSFIQTPLSQKNSLISACFKGKRSSQCSVVFFHKFTGGMYFSRRDNMPSKKRPNQLKIDFVLFYVLVNFFYLATIWNAAIGTELGRIQGSNEVEWSDPWEIYKQIAS